MRSRAAAENRKRAAMFGQSGMDDENDDIDMGEPLAPKLQAKREGCGAGGAGAAAQGARGGDSGSLGAEAGAGTREVASALGLLAQPPTLSRTVVAAGGSAAAGTVGADTQEVAGAFSQLGRESGDEGEEDKDLDLGTQGGASDDKCEEDMDLDLGTPGGASGDLAVPFPESQPLSSLRLSATLSPMATQAPTTAAAAALLSGGTEGASMPPPGATRSATPRQAQQHVTSTSMQPPPSPKKPKGRCTPASSCDRPAQPHRYMPPAATVCAEYLDTNASTHAWPLGAFAELLDNSRDARATFAQVDVLAPVDTDHGLAFTDDGVGLLPEQLRRAISLGYSSSRGDKTRIGEYGNGLKSSSIAIGADTLLLCRAADPTGPKGATIVSAGLLSKTMHHDLNFESFRIPLVAWKVPPSGCAEEATPWTGPPASSGDVSSGGAGNAPDLHDDEANMVCFYSRYVEKEELLSAALEHLPTTGMRMELDKISETLDLTSESDDILFKKGFCASKRRAKEHPMDTSLRRYTELLFLPNRRLAPQGDDGEPSVVLQDLKISIKGVAVEHCRWDVEGLEYTEYNNMFLTSAASYTIPRPMHRANTSEQSAGYISQITWPDAHELKVTIVTCVQDTAVGRTANGDETFELAEAYTGACFYHNGRLVDSFRLVGQQRKGLIPGVVLIVEEDVLRPMHNKQGYHEDASHRHIQTKLRMLLEESYLYSRDCKADFIIVDEDGTERLQKQLQEWLQEAKEKRRLRNDEPAFVQSAAERLGVRVSKISSVQCERCYKFRYLPLTNRELEQRFPGKFYCELNEWDEQYNTCEALQEEPQAAVVGKGKGKGKGTGKSKMPAPVINQRGRGAKRSGGAGGSWRDDQGDINARNRKKVVTERRSKSMRERAKKAEVEAALARKVEEQQRKVEELKQREEALEREKRMLEREAKRRRRDAEQPSSSQLEQTPSRRSHDGATGPPAPTPAPSRQPQERQVCLCRAFEVPEDNLGDTIWGCRECGKFFHADCLCFEPEHCRKRDKHDDGYIFSCEDHSERSVGLRKDRATIRHGPSQSQSQSMQLDGGSQEGNGISSTLQVGMVHAVTQKPPDWPEGCICRFSSIMVYSHLQWAHAPHAPLPGVEIRKLQPLKHPLFNVDHPTYGLFATEMFKAGEVIGQYTGFVGDEKDAALRNNEFLFQLILRREVDGRIKDDYRVTVDARNYGSQCRFINHYCGVGQQNCEFEQVATAQGGLGGILVNVVAKSEITRGTEFLIDYGPEYLTLQQASQEEANEE